MNFSCLPEFQREFKKLSKKIISLGDDLENFKKFIVEVDFDNNKRFITLWRDDKKQMRIIKTRLMVRSLKGSTKTRLIFSFCVKVNQIEFIEIYLKNNKEREDKKRIEDYLKNFS